MMRRWFPIGGVECDIFGAWRMLRGVGRALVRRLGLCQSSLLSALGGWKQFSVE